MEGWEAEGGREEQANSQQANRQIQGLWKSQRFPPIPSRTPRLEEWASEWERFLVLDFPLGEYLAPLSFLNKAGRLSSLTQHSCSLSRPV